MMSLKIRLTPEQEAQVDPLTRVLHEGLASIGQILFYDDETVLLVGVLTADATKRVREIVLDDNNLLELQP